MEVSDTDTSESLSSSSPRGCICEQRLVSMGSAWVNKCDQTSVSKVGQALIQVLKPRHWP